MLRHFLSAAAIFITPQIAFAERLESHCLAFAEREEKLPIQYASTGLQENEVALTYIRHSMYEIAGHGGI